MLNFPELICSDEMVVSGGLTGHLSWAGVRERGRGGRRWGGGGGGAIREAGVGCE